MDLLLFATVEVLAVLMGLLAARGLATLLLRKP